MEALPCPTRHILHFISLQRGLQHKHSQHSHTAPSSGKVLLCQAPTAGTQSQKRVLCLPCNGCRCGQKAELLLTCLLGEARAAVTVSPLRARSGMGRSWETGTATDTDCPPRAGHCQSQQHTHTHVLGELSNRTNPSCLLAPKAEGTWAFPGAAAPTCTSRSPSANSRATLPRAAPRLSLSPGEREGTDLHGFEGGDEREHDVVARPARAGQQRTAPAEREESRERLRTGANSRGWLWGHAGRAQTARGHSWGTENCISAHICQQFPSRRAERT